MAPTSVFGSVVRKANRSDSISPSFTLRTDFHPPTQIPAKNASGRSSFSANHAGGRVPSGCGSGSLNDVNGTTHRFSGPSQRRQCADFVFRTLVTPESVFLPFRAKAGDGIPHRAIASSRTPSEAVRTIGAE